MLADGMATFLSTLDALRPAFTRPGFDNLVVIFVGWVLTNGPHAVTQALVVTGIPGRRHHEAFHRFFSRGTWIPDRVGHLLFDKVLTKGLDHPLISESYGRFSGATGAPV